jgi:hypothetical protein
MAEKAYHFTASATPHSVSCNKASWSNKNQNFSRNPKTDHFLKTVVEGWQVTAKALGSVPEMVIKGIFPWCFTPELYEARPEYIQTLADFVRSRPAQPLEAFLQESSAVIVSVLATPRGLNHPMQDRRSQ